jgi:hypothetical protein
MGVKSIKVENFFVKCDRCLKELRGKNTNGFFDTTKEVLAEIEKEEWGILCLPFEGNLCDQLTICPECSWKFYCGEDKLKIN